MLNNEIREIIEEFITLYPNTYRYMNESQKERMAKQWLTKYGDFKKEDVIEAMLNFERDSEYPNPPTTKQLVYEIRKVIGRKNNSKGGKRIETPKEVRANMYHEIMAKPNKSEKDWEMLELLKKDVELFEGVGWQERYKNHFGAYREEFEKLWTLVIIANSKTLPNVLKPKS